MISFRRAGIGILLLTLTGCATPAKKNLIQDYEQLKKKVVSLNQQILQKDEEIKLLKGQLVKQDKEIQHLIDELEKEKMKHEKIKKAVLLTPKNIQIALRNAGFYKGPINGKIGPLTKKAIKEFQKSNGLNADGIVGKQTWQKLKNHL